MKIRIALVAALIVGFWAAYILTDEQSSTSEGHAIAERSAGKPAALIASMVAGGSGQPTGGVYRATVMVNAMVDTNRHFEKPVAGITPATSAPLDRVLEYRRQAGAPMPPTFGGQTNLPAVQK